MANKFLFLCLVAVVLKNVHGHGYLKIPSNRGSLWRLDARQPKYYNDNEFFCGGVSTQFSQNGGLCGVCGDNYADPRPRKNENTGTYGNGVVAAIYSSGSIIEVTVDLTANHKGAFVFSLCVLTDPTLPEREECFENLKLADDSDSFAVPGGVTREIPILLQLPAGITCERCVLRWHYKSANSWGTCEDGTGAMGCGAQETFRNCADISIV